LAVDWFQRFEGAGLDVVMARIRKAVTSPTSGQCLKWNMSATAIVLSPVFAGIEMVLGGVPDYLPHLCFYPSEIAAQ
jgi:hypothetical protein